MEGTLKSSSKESVSSSSRCSFKLPSGSWGSEKLRLNRTQSTASSSYSNASTVVFPKWEWNSNKLLDLEQLRAKEPQPDPDADTKGLNFFLESLKYGQQIQKAMPDIPDIYINETVTKRDPKYDPEKKKTPCIKTIDDEDPFSQDYLDAIDFLDTTLKLEDSFSDDEEDETLMEEDLAEDYDKHSVYLFKGDSPSLGQRRSSQESLYFF